MANRAADIIGRNAARVGHLAVWAGLYQVGLTVALGALMGVRWGAAGVLTLCGVFLLAVSVYLLDRVKPVNAWWDEADVMAHPERCRFLRARPGLVRVCMLVMGMVSAALLGRMHGLLIVVVVGAYAGVLVYGSLPRRPRPKDVLIVKNVVVATAMTALALAVLHASEAEWRWSSASVAIAFGVLVVTADAMLCDMDDAASDARFGTRTIPSVFSPTWAWVAGALLHASAGTLAWAAFARELAPSMVPAWLGWCLAVATLGWGVAGRGRTRDVVDARLLVITLILLAVLGQ